MDKATLAIIISSISAAIAGLSLGWNIYRDVILKPRLKVNFEVRTLFTPRINTLSKFISISAANLGTRSTTIQNIRAKWKTELIMVTNLSLEIPKRLEASEKVQFQLPYNTGYCEFLLGDCRGVGLEDAFGKIHWVKRKDFEKVREKWQEDLKLGEIELGEPPSYIPGP